MTTHTTSVNQISTKAQNVTVRIAGDRCINVTVGQKAATQVNVMATRAIIEKSIINMYPDAVVIMGGATPPSQNTIEALVAEGYQLDNILYAKT